MAKRITLNGVNEKATTIGLFYKIHGLRVCSLGNNYYQVVIERNFCIEEKFYAGKLKECLEFLNGLGSILWYLRKQKGD